MSKAPGKDNPAFAGEYPLNDMTSGHVLSDTQVTLQDVDMEPARKQRHHNINNGSLPQKEEDDDDEYPVPKPKPFNPDDHNALARGIMVAQTAIGNAYRTHKVIFWRCVGIVLLVAFLVYFGFAMAHEFGDEASIRLLVCTILGFCILLLHLMRHQLEPITAVVEDFLSSPNHTHTRRIIRWVLYVLSSVATVTLIIVLVALKNPENLLSLAGLAGFIIICFVTSYSPAQVDWHPVFWGFSLQFYFACLILKTDAGFEAFKWFGDRVTEFLTYSDAGAAFVFGDTVTLYTTAGSSIQISGAYYIHFFAFKLMPVVTFFSTVIAVCYYLGVMQAIVRVIGRFLSFSLGTTPAESLNAAGNIFVAMTASPLMIRPFVPSMTRSELHAVMTGGFATIAGSVLGAYIGFGVPADHLLSASVMSAPAALAISKLTYPEIDEPITQNTDYDKMEKTKEGNVIEAACNGAILSAKIIAFIIVNVIAFLSLLRFLNATLVWFGDRVGKADFTFEYICSYLLYPIAILMGTEPADCRKVAELVGVKTFTNEFVAYEKLAILLKNRQVFEAYEKNSNYTGQWEYSGHDINLTATGQILEKGLLSKRSEVIATYALCGFSNFGSMGIMLGGLATMAPKRQPDMAKLVFRAMLAGNVACFFTACIAGLFYESRD
ncbi:hypothetical protein EGW08_022348 [Elysia chlorotica]|uniref:Sodium/nucleoside cotransporter n=1 Tax=Elysia chlorotica TaxID=188477 RepID=A0A433SL65_ELYCH|nr:hypothetical protein EGW08_022348 [Elysia chlorotica]